MIHRDDWDNEDDYAGCLIGAIALVVLAILLVLCAIK